MTDRIEREKEFHNDAFDSKKRQVVGKYYTITESCWRQYRNQLSCSSNPTVLEYGCGPGSHAFWLSGNGATVHGIDISDVAIQQAKIKADSENLKNIFFHVMNAEDLQFDDQYFDLICGSGILHHLNLEKAYSQLQLKLKENGKAVFVEPLGHNPLINGFRLFTPKMRTIDEHPLKIRDIKNANYYFKSVDVQFFYLFSLGAVLFRNSRYFSSLLKILEKTDHLLFRMFPFMKRYAWMALIVMQNPVKNK